MKSFLPYILVVALFLSGCGPSYHLNRSKYHERMAIAKGANVSRDTIFIEKVVTVPEGSTEIEVCQPAGRFSIHRGEV
jgi:hypothetical protein